MDNASFIELLRDASILSKSDLTAHYANMIFREHACKLDPPKRINFHYFREVIVPILAAKKMLREEDLIGKLSRFECKKLIESDMTLREVILFITY
jgi:hypothetical protein